MSIVNDYNGKDEQARAYCRYQIKRFNARLSHMEKNHRHGLGCDEAKEIIKWRELFTYIQTKF